MNAPSTIRRPSAQILLARIVEAYGLLQASGDLAEAPTDLLNDLGAGDAAARELLEWLGEQVPSCMSADDWSGRSSYPRVL
jgi:hypothetical protein